MVSKKTVVKPMRINDKKMQRKAAEKETARVTYKAAAP